MKKYRCLCAFAFLLGSFGAVWAGGGDSLRIIALQNEVSGLRDSIAHYQKSSAQVLKLLNAAKEAAAEPWYFILLKIGLLLGLAVGLFLAFWWLLNKVAPDWHMKIIQRLVERYEEVNVLKREKKILLLNISGADAQNLRFVNNLLREFNLVETLEVSDGYVKPTKEFDVVFANFERGFDKEKHQPILHQYIEPDKHHGKALFSLVPTSSWNYALKPDLNSKVSIANVRAQVYGNLISLLKYHGLTNSKW